MEAAQPNAVTNLQNYVTTLITDTINQDQAAGGGNYLGSTGSGATSTWSIVWGPFVYSSDETSTTVVADNIMALFYNAVENVYMVGIAATNSVSTYDWLSEDSDTGDVTAWNLIPNPAGGPSLSNAPSDACISNGALNGMNALLAMKDSNGNSMVTALQTAFAANPAADIYVSGHSLGGGLTPFIALYLYENQSYWRPSGLAVTINALPTAGPTFSDNYFATYYTGLLNTSPSSSTLGFTYSNLCNTIDVVPMGYDLTTMINIPFVYDSYYTALGTPTDALSSSLVTALICSSFNVPSAWPHIPVDNNYTLIAAADFFTCTYQSGNPYSSSSSNPLANIPALSDLYTAFHDGIGAIFWGNSTLFNSKLYGSGETKGDTNYAYYLMDLGMYFLQVVYQHTIMYYGAPNTPSSAPMNVYDFMVEFQAIQATVTPPASVTFTSIPVAMAKAMIGKYTGFKNMDKLAALGKSAAKKTVA